MPSSGIRARRGGPPDRHQSQSPPAEEPARSRRDPVEHLAEVARDRATQAAGRRCSALITEAEPPVASTRQHEQERAARPTRCAGIAVGTRRSARPRGARAATPGSRAAHRPRRRVARAVADAGGLPCADRPHRERAAAIIASPNAIGAYGLASARHLADHAARPRLRSPADHEGERDRESRSRPGPRSSRPPRRIGSLAAATNRVVIRNASHSAAPTQGRVATTSARPATASRGSRARLATCSRQPNRRRSPSRPRRDR